MPFPCPIGTYCRTGATHNIQCSEIFKAAKVFRWIFCPFGSTSLKAVVRAPLDSTVHGVRKRTGRHKRQVTLYEAIVCPEGMLPWSWEYGAYRLLSRTYNPFKGSQIVPRVRRVMPRLETNTATDLPSWLVCMSEGLCSCCPMPAGYFVPVLLLCSQMKHTVGGIIIQPQVHGRWLVL